MAHMIENMMYMGETPWHGLGKKLNTPPSSEEAIKEAGLDWKVTLTPIGVKTVDDPLAAYIPQPDFLAIKRQTDDRVYGVVKPGWTPLQNVEAFNFFDPIVKEGLAEYHTAGSLSNGERVWILAKLKGDPMQVVSGDIVDKFLLLSNGHNGKVGVRVSFTPIRVVCNNTLSMAEKDGSQALRVVHSARVAKTLEDLREVVNFANQKFEATLAQYKKLANAGVLDLERYVTSVFYPTKLDLACTEGMEVTRTVGKVIELFKTHPTNNITGISGSLWAAYNAVTYYVDHERGKDESRLGQAWYGAGKQIKDIAFETALRLVA